MLCADTSFLFSLYRSDGNTEKAHERLKKAAQPLLLSSFNEYELGNALRFAEYRGLLSPGEAAQRMTALAEDGVAGRWLPSDIALEDILAEAGRLSLAHTMTGEHRAFDILHVAHARLAKPKCFLSFDVNQLRLARVVGLSV